MSRTRDGMNLDALRRMLGGRPPPEAADQPLAAAAVRVAASAGGSAGPSVFVGAVPADWTGSPGNHDGRQMRVTYGAGTWGVLVEIFSVVDDVETVHKTFDVAPAFSKVCIGGVEVYRCILMDPSTDAVA